MLPRQILSRTRTFLIAAICAAMVVTLLVLVFDCEALGDWLRTLAATAISALFAVAVGIGLFNRQTKMADEQRKQQLVAVLEVQAHNMKDVLTATKSQAKPVEGVLATQIDPLALDEAVRSGLFSIDDTQLFYSLASEIRMYNLQVGNALSKGKASTYAAAWLINSRNEMIEHSEHLLTRLGQLKS